MLLSDSFHSLMKPLVVLKFFSLIKSWLITAGELSLPGF